MVVLASTFAVAQILFFGGVAVIIWLDRTRPCPTQQAWTARAVSRARRVLFPLRVRTMSHAGDRATLPYPLPWSYVMARAVASPPLRQLPADVSGAEKMRPAA